MIVLVGGRIVGETTVVVSRSVIWLVGSVVDGISLWSSLARAGAAGATALATPQSAAAFLILEAVAGLALYGLRGLVAGKRPWAFEKGRI